MSEGPISGVHRLGASVLDVGRGTLVRDGAVVPLRPKTYDLLAFLACNGGRVLSKDELFAAVWPGVIVTEDSLTQAIRDARRAIGDEAQAVIRTVSRRGYLCACEAVEATAPAVPATAAEPVVAVLPFRCDSDRPGDRVLTDGLVEEITNALARFRTVTVLAHGSASAFGSRDRPPLPEVATRLGAEFLVEGSVRRHGDRLLVTSGLVEASGRQVWAETRDVEEADLLALDVTIAHRIVVRLVSNLEDAVLRRAARRPSRSLAAFEHLVRGMTLLRGYGPGVNVEGRAHLDKALALDPDSGLAHAYRALADVIIGGYGGAPRPVLQAARDRALKATLLAPEEARCQRILALTRLFLKEYAAAESHFRRAIDLNPYDADSLAQMGYLLALRGRAQEGLHWMERAMRLNPLHPDWYRFDHGIVLFGCGDYVGAIRELELVPRDDPRYHARLAASRALAGDLAGAAASYRTLLVAAPEFDVEAFAADSSFEHEADRARLAEGLDRARDALAALRGAEALSTPPPG